MVRNLLAVVIVLAESIALIALVALIEAIVVDEPVVRGF